MTEPPDKTNACEFQIGDHIYQWCSFVGIPSVFQHHGIVMDCYWKEQNDENDDEVANDDNNSVASMNKNIKNVEISDSDGEWIIEIADFSNVDHLDRQRQRDTTATTYLPDGSTIDASFTAPPPSASNRKRSFGMSSKSSSNSNDGYRIRTFTVSLSSKHERWHKVIYSSN